MGQLNNLSINELKKIRLCDSSYLNDGIDLLLQNFESAKDFEDIDDSLLSVPLHNDKVKSLPLYHYTDANALLSIISSCNTYEQIFREVLHGKKEKKKENKESFTLRFSRVDYMNDIYDGGEIFNSIFQECLQNELSEVKDSFKLYIREMVENLQNGKYSNTKRVSYICSLTVDGDSLPMWRNYSNLGGGYNIKFDSKALEEHSLDGFLPNVVLIPVVYDYKVMIRIIKSVMTKLSMLWDENNASRFEGLLFNFISDSKLSFKHPSFSHEQEVRLLKYGSKRIHDVNPFESFSESNAILRPHINVEIPTKSVVGITVGPLLEAEAAKRSVEDLIGRYMGINSPCRVNISSAPIRF